jgi:Co/Zn/Cd efflux system component
MDKLGHTFGFHRAEVIAALVSVLTIWVLTGFLVHEAIQRISHPQVINAKLVFCYLISVFVPRSLIELLCRCALLLVLV